MSAAPQSTAINPQSAIPALFVLLWSTGFIGMRYGAPHAEPFTFMTIRMAIVVTILLAVSLAMRAPWPRSWQQVAHLCVAGTLVHATYLSGILFAIGAGMPVGLVALIAGLQPLLTAFIARFLLAERLSAQQWLGMAFGLVGVLLVVASKFSGSVSLTAALAPIAFAVTGLFGITLGTLYQKRFCAEMDLRTGGVVQFSATMILLGALSLLLETGAVRWNAEFIFALLWLAIVLSLGAISLLYWMIRRGAASKVASLFFLTPSVTALMGFVLFGEAFPPLAVVGLLVSAVGVALVTKS